MTATAVGADLRAYDELPDGVVVVDGNGVVVAVNDLGAQLLGVPADGLVGADYRQVLAFTDPRGRDWWECTAPYDGLSSRVRQPERQLVLRAGEDGQRELLVTVRYVRDKARRVVRLVVCLRDIRARERQERDRADLVSTVAHELRSPLTSVKGFTATLLSRWERFNDEQKRLMLETINADADRVTRLIAELLDVSRIDAGRIELRKQVVDVAAAARKAFEGRIAGGEPADRFELTVDGELPEIWADPDKLDQVIGNLVENGLRHGGGKVRVTVAPEPMDPEPGVAVCVMDEGPGIAPEAVGRIFTRFWRDRRHGGTGLGLYICKGLVEAHGGTIVAGRAPTGGALFRFTLPAGTPAFAR